MESKSPLILKLQSLITVILLIAIVGALAWISNRYVLQFDWTAAGRNTLSQASRELLRTLVGPVEVTAYARENKVLRQAVRELVDRYRAEKPDIALSFVNPDKAPEEVRSLGITAEGELLVRFDGRSEQLKSVNERTLTNALNRVARPSKRRVVYLSGHGERDLLGPGNHDLGGFSAQLEQRGFSVIRLDLNEVGGIPDNTDVLVLSEGEIPALPGELELVRGFLSRGGNLLWLADPTLTSMRALGGFLGVSFLPGRIIEPATRSFGVDDPAVVIVSKYGAHPVTRKFNLLTVLPGAAAMRVAARDGWEPEALLKTSAQSWNETGGSAKEPARDTEEEIPGPLDLGLALTRALEPGNNGGPSQRVVIIGDGDFLSNAYLGNAGNLDLGLKLFNWLGGDDAFIDIPARTAPDLDFNLSRTLSLVVAFVPLAVIPVMLLATGFFVWRRRRMR